MNKKLLSINVSSLFKLDNHNVNASNDGTPKEVGGKVYISGQKIKNSLFKTIKDIYISERTDVENITSQSVVSTGDAPTGDIINDIRSDLGGYLLTSKDSMSENRKSPINVAFAVSLNRSNYYDDLFVRFKNSKNDDSDDKHKQRINSKIYSEGDFIPVNYQMRVDQVGRVKSYEIKDAKFVKEISTLKYSADVKLDRISLFIRATEYLNDMANTSRNAIDNRAKKIFITFGYADTFIKYFELSAKEQENLLKELASEDIPFFIGDNNSDKSVSVAVKEALEYLKTNSDKFFI